MVAYDKLTGDVKWKTPSLGYVGYVSPAIVEVGGEDHVVMITPSTNPFRRSSPDENNLGKVIGIEPLTGKILWEYDKWECHISVASAVDAGENRVLAAGGYELGTVVIEVEKMADGAFRSSTATATPASIALWLRILPTATFTWPTTPRPMGASGMLVGCEVTGNSWPGQISTDPAMIRS